MTKLMTSTAVGLIAAFAMQAQAQTNEEQTAAMEDPCTAQWVAVDANNDGRISQSEAQEAMQVQFSQIDRDGDGMISIKNWKDCTVPSAIPGGFQSAAGTGTERTPPGALTEGQQQDGESTRALQAPDVSGVAEPGEWTEEQFTEMDTDESGDVSGEEAAKWSRNQLSGEMQDQEETLGRYGAMFAMTDMDADGTITREEWQVRQQMNIEGRFGRVDQDGDGQISMSEWRDYREQRYEQAQAEAGEEPTIWMYYFRSL